MILIISSVFVLQVIIVKYLIHDTISKDFIYIFLSYWTFALSLTTFRPFNFYEVSPTTFIILITAVTSFLIGYSCVGKYYRIRQVRYNLYAKLLSLSKSKLLILLVLLVSLYESQFSINALILSEESTSIITEDKQEFMFMGNKFALLIWMYIMFPLFHIQCIVISNLIIHKHRPPCLYLFSVIIFFVVFGILNGGRTLFIIFFLYLIFTYMFSFPRSSIFKIGIKKAIGGIAIFICLFIGMMYMTAYRLSGKFEIETNSFRQSAEQMSETPLKYSVLPIVLFDISLKENYVDKLGGYQYGAYTFCGVDIFISGFAKKFGIKKESSEYIINYLQDNWKNCNPTKSYNYAYTGVFSHYMDLGYFGVIFFPLLFGIIVRLSILSFLNHPSIYKFFLVTFFFYLTIHSVFSNYLHSTWMIVYILFLIICNYTTKFHYIITRI